MTAMTSRMKLDLVYASPRWTGRRATSAMLRKAADVVAAAFSEPTDKQPQFHAAIRLTDDAEMRGLNARFRNKDKATNVLSFPTNADSNEPGPHSLGDIAIGYETVCREAEHDGKSFDHHLTHLMIHGLLHLMGYDHLTPDEAEEMEALEVELLALLAIPDPYAEFELVSHPPIDA